MTVPARGLRFDRRTLLRGAASGAVLLAASGCRPGEPPIRPIPEMEPEQFVRVPPQHLRYVPSPIPLAQARPEGNGPSVTPFVDPLPVPPVLRPDASGELTVEMRSADVSLHSELPPTPIWGYGGTAVGPTIEVRRGSPLTVAWRNAITTGYPAVPVALEDNEENELPSWDFTGREGVDPLPAVERLPPWTVVHLHGAVVGGGSDGWAENGVGPGGVQLSTYPNDQPAAGLWYHDHAMHVTRYTTMAGLTAGAYLVRDDEEAALGLPSGPYELPLVVADRHLDTDASGALTGRILYKTILFPSETTVVARAFTGPFTLVNGVIWPYHDVEPRRYRLRVLNASHLRPYHLQLQTEDEEPVRRGTVLRIGTDAGLLPAPVDAADTGDRVLLVPAERADVLVDFSAFAGQTVRLVNADEDPGPYPQVMEFRVGSGPAAGSPAPAVVASSFEPVPADLPVAAERMVMVTRTFPGEAEMWETVRAEPPRGDLPMDGIVQVQGPDGELRTYERVARTFPERMTVVSECDTWERWQFLSLERTGYPHPMHLHAAAFQATSRDLYDVEGFEYFLLPDGRVGGGTRTPVRYEGPGVLGPEERGWKDVVRVDRRELVTVAATFRRVPGRFLYHCHVYEHEDMAMMRPFLLRPAGVAEIGTALGTGRAGPVPSAGHGH